MSSDDSGPGRREVAYRLFATEFDDADFSYSESDEERAPNYVVTPTGARVNRLFVAGVLTEIEQVSDDVLRARVVDPTGAFVVYAGQYQPDVLAFLDRTDPPAFVALTGKARTFQPEDGDRVFTSVRPETMNTVDADTRDRWTVATAERTLDRVATMARALSSDASGDDLRAELVAAGVDEGFAAGIPLAIDHYGTTGAYLQAVRDLALEAAAVVAGERDEVDPLTAAPDTDGPADLAALVDAGTDDPISVDESETAPETTAARADDDASAPAGATTDDAVPAEPTAGSSDTLADESGSDTLADEGGSDALADEGGDDSPADAPEPEAATDAADSTTDAADAGGADDLEDFEPGEFELDDDTREEVQQEYGTEFQSGTEVQQPGEAGIEPETGADEVDASGSAAAESAEGESASGESATDEPSATESTADMAADAEAAAEESDSTDEPADDATAEPAAAEPAEDVDVEDAVMDAMHDLDDGTGADREAVVASVADDYGFDPEAVEDAVQDALMDGLCYEPDDGLLKPI